ncbi:MAG: TRAP transporter small permease [Chloroflexi bacterium]|nr:TRAP transporter small permease [Chloroflexota bacterium]
MEMRPDNVTTEMPAASGRFSILHYLDNGVSAIERALNYIAVGLIIVFMFFSTAAVSSRYLFNKPLSGYIDIAEITMVIVVFFGLAYTQWAGAHVRVELFITRYIKGRLHYLTEAFTTFLSLIFFAFITVYGFKGTLEARAINDITLSIYWPIWPIKLCLAIGSLVLCFRFIVQVFQHVSRAITGTVANEND